MLTLIPRNSSHTVEAHITLPESATLADVERFCRLAAVFYGHHSADGTWIFTEVRGKKCLALWQAGFDGNGQCQKAKNKPISRGGVNFEVSEAIRMAKAMEATPEPAMAIENLD
jgi:hypothetical protein